jgi:serine/threonine protein kinase
MDERDLETLTPEDLARELAGERPDVGTMPTMDGTVPPPLPTGAHTGGPADGYEPTMDGTDVDAFARTGFVSSGDLSSDAAAGGPAQISLAATMASEPAGTDEGPALGTHIAHYELIRPIGEGGMGTVHLARDTKLGRRVAIKTMRAVRTGSHERFLQEARATARLQHEHIVVIHEVGEHDGMPYLVLEFLEGQPLRAVLGDRPLPPARALELVMPIVRALVHAHKHGLVHRDLKPENVFLTEGGAIKVLDFGIAKLSGAEEAAVHIDGPAPTHGGLTAAGAVVGTLLYMAPEQWRGSAVDHRADQYALGMMLYEMLAGRHPFDSVDRSEVLMISRGERPIAPLANAAPQVPSDLESVVNRCLAVNPAARFETTADLLDALQAAAPSRHGTHLKAGESPYPGLSAFGEHDAGRFFGRERDINRVVKLLDEQPLVAIVGPSGVGKSSLVRAGVIPAMRATSPVERFTVRPGRRPLDALASLLFSTTTDMRSADSRMARVASLTDELAESPGHFGAMLRERCEKKGARGLVFVDQFEELWTLTEDPAVRAAFLSCLLGAADDPSSPLRVVVSMRSDFLDRVSSSSRLMESVTRGLVLLQPPDGGQLRAALVGPAEAVGYTFEDDALVREMLAGLENTPAALPLLQFAAGKLWDTRDTRRRLLTRAAYESMGGLTGLLATHADAVLAELPPEAQARLRALFLRLVTPERTRAVVEREELLGLAEQPEQVQALIDRLVDARLLVVQTRGTDGGATCEIAHEALIENWPTLRRWLDEGREHAGFVALIANAARQWDQKGRRAGLVWRGEAAEDAFRFSRQYKGRLAPHEQDYLATVLRLRERRRRMRVWSIASTIAVLLLVVAVGATALVRISAAEEDAREQADRAKESARALEGANAALQQQFEAVKKKEQERAAAESAAVEARKTAEARGEDLDKANDDLRDALDQAKADQLRAIAAEQRATLNAARARASAMQQKRLAADLESALQREQARVKALEERARQIQTTLR